MTAKKTKRVTDAPIEQVVRLLAQAAGIAQRKRMGATLRRLIGNAIHAAFNEAERARGRQ